MNQDDHPSETSVLDNLILASVTSTALSHDLSQGSDDEKRLVIELNSLFENRQLAQRSIDLLFPEGVPADVKFFERVKKLVEPLGWGDSSARATGGFLSAAVMALPPEQGESLLLQIVNVANPEYFQLLDGLPILVEQRTLRGDFVARWFPSMVRRIGNDHACGGFWKAASLFCERQTAEATTALQALREPKDEAEVHLAACFLGTMKSLPTSTTISTRLESLASSFSESSDPKARAVFLRSWIHSAQRGVITPEQVFDILERAMNGIADERELAFWIANRMLVSSVIPQASFDAGMRWLLANSASAPSPLAKHHVVDLAAHLSPSLGRPCEELILSVQPIAKESKGTWRRIGDFLVGRLKADFEAFVDFSLRLARLDQGGWLKAMQESRSFDWLLSEMQGKDCSLLVGRLVLSRAIGSRKLGLFLFDRLKIDTLPAQLTKQEGEDGFRMALHELQRTMVHGDAIGRYLISLIPCSEDVSPQLQAEFFGELLLQTKNFGGSCNVEFERRKEDFPLLKKVLAEGERYFASLKQTQKSPISAMEVAGYRQASRLYSRRFSNEVAQKSEEFSVFAQFFKKTALLYAKQWSSFHDGRLSGKSELQQISSSVEVPRLEFIDPEVMALRRLNASEQLARLSKDDTGIKEAQ